MWWLCGVDLALPFGDAIYVAGIAVISVSSSDKIVGAVEEKAEAITLSNSYLAKKKRRGKGKGISDPPDVTYSGNDPTKSPGEGYEWRGKQPVGGNKGAWVNKSTGEQWHPDLNHQPPKGPHWDYTDILGIIWSVFEDGLIMIWGD